MSEWAADIEVTEPLARRLITAQFPDLDSGRLTGIGEGWDYTIWATADQVAFRFPRRQMVLAGMGREMALLPALSQQLTVEVPDAGYRGAPSREFAWPFFGSRLIEGEELTRAKLSDSQRVPLAGDLGAFLRELHALAPPPQLAAVVDPNHRADMSVRVPKAREMIARVAPHWPAAPRAEPILAAAERLPPESSVVLSHGDLHLRQILVSDRGALTGVVDWVDVCLAPVSVDLGVLWSLFAVEARENFLAAYGSVDCATLLRARALALCLSAMLASYALDRGDEMLWKETLAELDRALVG
jgi:aminoglycoside phosphotransferase (APT) family kinase protein